MVSSSVTGTTRLIMDGTIPTPTASSTVTNPSTFSLQVPPFQLLEINIISAQDLQPIAKSMRTYAVAWLHPNRRLTTRIDPKGHISPTWNDKLLFRVDDEFLSSETSSLTIEIYNVSWFRDVLVGSVEVLISNLFTPGSTQDPSTKRFVTLQVHRPSGSPQGILNMGFCLGIATNKQVPLYSELSDGKLDGREGGDEAKYVVDRELIEGRRVDDGDNVVYEDEMIGEELRNQQQEQLKEKIQIWRSHSVETGLNNYDDDEDCGPGSVCNGSMVNGSMINGSEVCSDVGPSASIVAAEIAKRTFQQQRALPPMVIPPFSSKPQRVGGEGDETGSSILEELTLEQAMAKGWKLDLAPTNLQIVPRKGGNTRRHSDGGGLFKCFGNAYGIEFTIVCGSNQQSPNKSFKAKKSASCTNNTTASKNSMRHRSKKSTSDQHSI